jgi:ribosomal 50S subunit-recycling heat shock protein
VRLDLFLKWSRVVPRRTLAHDTCAAGCVSVNGEVARPAHTVKVEDVIDVVLPNRRLRFRVCSIPERRPAKTGAGEMIEMLENVRREDIDP